VPAQSALVELWVDVTPECDALLVARDKLVGVGIPALERVENCLVKLLKRVRAVDFDISPDLLVGLESQWRIRMDPDAKHIERHR